MTTTVDNLRKFYDSENYRNLLNEICETIKLRMAGPAPDIVYNLDLNNLAASNIALSELESILTADEINFKQYLLKKISRSSCRAQWARIS